MYRPFLSLVLLTASAVSAPAFGQSEDRPYVFRDAGDAQVRKDAFQTLDGYLKLIGSAATVSDCKTLLWSHPGTVEGVYVGDCRLTNQAEVIMCGDTGVGEFGLSWGEGGDRDRLVAFAHANCPGG